MNISITGRHMEVSDSIKEYATKKIQKLEKYFHQLIDCNLVLFIIKQDQFAELLVNGDGVQFFASVKAGDMYSAIDLLMDKMENQIVRYKEKHSGHKATALGELPLMEETTQQGVDIRLTQTSNKPIDETEAYLEMRVDDQDFILFKKGVQKVDSNIDYANRNYALIFKNEKGYKLVEIPYDLIKKDDYDVSKFIEYTIDVKDESPANPVIKLKKQDTCCSISDMTVDEAIQQLIDNTYSFLPFFNRETNSLNIVHENGKSIEVVVPAF
jgi:putative sigma-54 modulation protein